MTNATAQAHDEAAAKHEAAAKAHAAAHPDEHNPGESEMRASIASDCTWYAQTASEHAQEATNPDTQPEAAEACAFAVGEADAASEADADAASEHDEGTATGERKAHEEATAAHNRAAAHHREAAKAARNA